MRAINQILQEIETYIFAWICKVRGWTPPWEWDFSDPEKENPTQDKENNETEN